MRQFLTILILIIGLPGFAQTGQIQLSVFDGETNETLPFCHICTENLSDGEAAFMTTDIDGIAIIDFKGKTIISISFMGYESLLDTLTEYSLQLSYKLYPSSFNLNEVVITGRNKAIPVDKSIYSIKVIDAREIENKASNDLSELLKNELSIRLSNDAALGSSLDMQGISGENIKILVDGVPMIGRMDGNIDLSQINMDEVDHIEIVEGPMSVMYGSNALGGVINIITKENKYARLKTGIETYYESVGVYNANGHLYWKKNKNDFGLTFGRKFFEGYSTDPDARNKQFNPKEQYHGGLQYLYSNKRLKSKTKVDFFRERLLIRSMPEIGPYTAMGYDSWYYSTRANVNTNFDYDFAEAGNLDLMVAYSYYERAKKKYVVDLTTLNDNLSPNTSDHDTTTFDAIVVRGVYNSDDRFENIEYQMGVDANYESSGGKRIEGDENEIGDYALFTSLKWAITNRIDFQPALRIAYNSQYDAPLVPSINLKYHIGKTLFRLSYARGFRAPSLKELYLSFFDSNHEVEGNPDLEAEYSHNFNLAISHKTKLFGRPAKLRLSSFYNRIFNQIDLVEVDPDNPMHYKNENVGDLQTTGATFNASLAPCRFFDLSIGVSEIGRYSEWFPKDEFIFSTDLNGDLTAKLFKNTMSFTLSYKYSGKFPRYATNPDTDELILQHIKDFQNMDMGITKSFFKRQLVISAGIKNLFDNTYIAGASNGSAHSSSSGSMVGWGRTFYFGIKYNFSQYDK